MKFSIYRAKYQETENVSHIEIELFKTDLADILRDGAIILPVVDGGGVLSQVIALKLKSG